MKRQVISITVVEDDQVKIYSRENFESYEYDYFVVGQLPKDEIKEFAIDELKLIEREDADEFCGCPDITDLPDEEIIDTLKQRGYYIVKPGSIVESQRVEEFINQEFPKCL